MYMPLTSLCVIIPVRCFLSSIFRRNCFSPYFNINCWVNFDPGESYYNSHILLPFYNFSFDSTVVIGCIIPHILKLLNGMLWDIYSSIQAHLSNQKNSSEIKVSWYHMCSIIKITIGTYKSRYICTCAKFHVYT
mgnify:FL=1